MKKIIPILAMTGMLLNPFNLESIVANDHTSANYDYQLDLSNAVQNPTISPDEILSVFHLEADSRRDDYIQGGVYSGNIPGLSNADYRKDSFTGDMMFYSVDQDNQTILTQAIKYRGNGIDSYFDNLMSRWLNLFKGGIENRVCVSDQLLPSYIDVPTAEAQNFAGVKNPLLIAYSMRTIQEMSVSEDMISNHNKYLYQVTDKKLTKILNAIDNHKYNGSYQQVYQENPSNDLAKANVLMTIAVQEKNPEYMSGNRENIINKAMDYVNSAIEKYENDDNMFYKYLEHCYGPDEVNKYKQEFQESLAYTLGPIMPKELWENKIQKIKAYEETYLKHLSLFKEYK